MIIIYTNSRFQYGGFYRVIYKIVLAFLGIKRLTGLWVRFGFKNYFRKIKICSGNTNKVGVLAIVKNESDYIQEWIEYHRLIGVSKFFIFDNESTDSTHELLLPYIQEGIVEYTYFTDSSDKKQMNAYMLGVKKATGIVDWLITIDIDEFVQSMDDWDLIGWLKDLPVTIAQVQIGWMIFGSSGFKEKPQGLTTENFLYHAPDDFIAEYKPIVRPERVITMYFPHHYEVAGITIDENKKIQFEYPRTHLKGVTPASKNKFRINHYYSKSLSEYLIKKKRGVADHPNDEDYYNMDAFKQHDQNQVFDPSMKMYSSQILKGINKARNKFYE